MPRLLKTRVEIEGRVHEEYVVIEEADEQIRPWGSEAELNLVGQPTPRIDGAARVTGSARYTYDIQLPGMLYARILRSPHPHARIRSLDASRAEQLPGVLAVMTHQNAPDVSWYGGNSRLLDTTLRFVGDEVAVVAATDPDIAADALELIEVDYEPLPFVIDAEEALKEGAPQVHPDGNLLNGKPDAYSKGDIETGFNEAEVIVEGTFLTPSALHNSLETHGSVATWEGDQLIVYDSTQWVFETRKQLARMLDLPLHKVRVIKHYMGGGFGSKIGAGKYCVMAALLSRQTGRPVHLMLTRQEENLATGNRPDTIFKLRLGATRDGKLTAMQGTAISNLGAYGGWTGGGLGPMRTYYSCPHVRTEEYGARTNLGRMSAFRAPGFVEGTFALESLMDELAERLGIDPLELRRFNLAERDPENNRPYSNNSLGELYAAAAEAAGWASRDRLRQQNQGPIRRGLGMATQKWGGSGGPPAHAWAKLNPDGSVSIICGTQDIGTGVKTALAQIAAEELGLPLQNISLEIGDTQLAPYGSISAGSMSVPSNGPAVRAAAADLKRQIFALAADMLEADPEFLTIENGVIYRLPGMDRSLTIREFGDRLGDAMLTGKGSRLPNPQDVTINTFGVQFAEVEVDISTGQVRVLRVVTAHDVGRVINPMGLEGQLNGGVIQALGFSLMEERVTDARTGHVLNPNLEGYKVPTALDIPAIDNQLIDLPDGAINNIGAKGAGEPPIIPTAGAIANAIYHATGVRIRHLPMTPGRVLEALRASQGEHYA